VQAALEGYNHDISQQQITILQTLSQPRFPWYVNSEVGMQTTTPLLSGAPIMTYQRYDARLEIDDAKHRRPEHIESLIGRDMRASEVERLRKLDIKDPEVLDVLYRAGEALGGGQLITRQSTDQSIITASAIAPDWPPASFDPTEWRAAPAPAAEAPPATAPPEAPPDAPPA
jgi:hypothetical protein